MDPVPPLFLFDGDCGFCRRWADWLQRRRPGDVTFVASQTVDLVAYGLTTAEVQAASYFIEDGHTPYRGNRSISRLLRHARWPWRALGLIGEAPGVRLVLAPLYRWIARNRHRLPAPR